MNLQGEVIGIDTAGAGASNAENIGFAISIDTAKSVIADAVSNPEAPVAFLGVTNQDVTPGLAFQFSLPVQRGVYVDAVAPQSPAEKAGIKAGDVIVAFDAHTVSNSDRLGSLIRTKHPGDQATVTFVDASGRRRTVSVTLGVRPVPVP